ncbi:MAG: AbrB/MazE/SpoVT family DNA-binding domain-containing protein [wastewater metagenome]|nr:AbrB/MazE/SpoVT family DNA-binding domain-containing protein [Candidatus Loosdrechtia aerotolerans]
MRRKICIIGNSYGVSIPKEILEKLQLTPGTQVEVKVDEKAKKIIIEPSVRESFQDTVDKEFAAQVNDFIERYRPALKTLAEK